MRGADLYCLKRCLPRMSWARDNLVNLYARTVGEGPKRQEISFKQPFQGQTLFQERWWAKKVTRAYHGDFINEKIFKRWYLPDNLPDVRPTRRVFDDTASLEEFAMRRKKEKELEEEEEVKGIAPVGSLMFQEVERRLDVLVFRCCFAHSVYEARRLVIHGYVKLNGKKHQHAHTRLAPGDLISVDPAAIRFLKPRSPPAVASPSQPEAVSAGEGVEGVEEGASTQEGTNTQVEINTQPEAEQRKDFLCQLPEYSAPWLFIPAYIEPSFNTCSAIYVRHPTARPGYSEIPSPYDADGEVMRFAWEWYVRRRPRMRWTQKRIARMPEDRAFNMRNRTDGYPWGFRKGVIN